MNMKLPDDATLNPFYAATGKGDVPPSFFADNEDHPMSTLPRILISLASALIGARIASSLLILMMGAPAHVVAAQFSPLGFVVMFFDPIDIILMLVFFGIGWAATSLVRKPS